MIFHYDVIFWVISRFIWHVTFRKTNWSTGIFCFDLNYIVTLLEEVFSGKNIVFTWNLLKVSMMTLCYSVKFEIHNLKIIQHIFLYLVITIFIWVLPFSETNDDKPVYSSHFFLLYTVTFYQFLPMDSIRNYQLFSSSLTTSEL